MDSSARRSFDTPILFLIFNRPDTTRRVFEQIRKVKPRQLFIAADGPRYGSDDLVRCKAARSVVEEVDWECEVQTLFSERNWGCGRGPARGITWFFDHVEDGIILEDDCLPTLTFFYFCHELLQKYRNDTRIMEIGGVNLVEHLTAHDRCSYHFSHHNHTWGWATWKRAWSMYDYKIKSYSLATIRTYLNHSFDSSLERQYFRDIFNQTFLQNESVTWWDYQWEFARRINSGLSIVPRNNLILNIGLGADATHTLDANGLGSKLSVSEMSFPLVHPEIMMVNKNRDAEYFKSVFTNWRSRVKHLIKRIVPVNGFNGQLQEKSVLHKG